MVVSKTSGYLLGIPLTQGTRMGVPLTRTCRAPWYLCWCSRMGFLGIITYITYKYPLYRVSAVISHRVPTFLIGVHPCLSAEWPVVCQSPWQEYLDATGDLEGVEDGGNGWIRLRCWQETWRGKTDGKNGWTTRRRYAVICFFPGELL